jgi:hypothetical protein
LVTAWRGEPTPLERLTERFTFALPPIVDSREVDDIRRGGQGAEIPGFVQPAEPADQLFEEAWRRFGGTLRAKVDPASRTGQTVSTRRLG